MFPTDLPKEIRNKKVDTLRSLPSAKYIKKGGPSQSCYMEQKPESLIYSAESSLWEAASSLTKSVEMRCDSEHLLERADMAVAY